MSAGAPTDIDPARLHELLRTQRYGRSLRLLEITESTNDDARRDAAAGAADGHVVLADSQRQGRGSHGRAWASPAGTCLYLSIVARPSVALAQLPPLTLAVGVGVAEAVERVLEPSVQLQAQVKWPNDVWLHGRKCAGILIEASSSGTTLGPIVIGIGLNVNRMQWPEELEAVATSLRAACPDAAALDRERALSLLLESVERQVDRFVAEGPAASVMALQARLALRGQRVRCGDVEGTLLGVSLSGALRIATEIGVRELIAGRLEHCPA